MENSVGMRRLMMHLLVVVAAIGLSASMAVADPTARDVLAKLKPGDCNYATGRVIPAALERVKSEAAQQGLVFLGPAGLKCWFIFENTLTPEATRAALKALAPQPEEDVSTAADSKLFAAAAENDLQPLPTPVPGSDEPADVTPAAVPPECPNGECPRLYGMNVINIAPIWRLPNLMPFTTIRKRGMVVDTGTDFAHRDFVGQLDARNSRTFNNNPGSGGLPNARPNTPPGGQADVSLPSRLGADHGTHVMGTVAGGWSTDDTRGIAGVLGPAQNSMLSCNAFTPQRGNNDDIEESLGAALTDQVRCFAHAAGVNSANVINLSLGGPGLKNQFYLDALKQLVCDNDGMAVISAGNDGVDININQPPNVDGFYPARYSLDLPDCVLTVAATDSQNRLTPFSNFGRGVGIAAPGDLILSDITTRSGDSNAVNPWASGVKSGTSMSAPHVAGVALVIRNAFPTATAAQVIRCLKSTATVMPTMNPPRTLDGGIMNAAAAFECVRNVAPLCPVAGLPPCVEPTAVSVSTDTRCPFGRFCTTNPAGQTCIYNLRRRGTVCRRAISQCDITDVCNGISSSCPDRVRHNKTPCDSRNNRVMANMKLVCLPPGIKSDVNDQVAKQGTCPAETVSAATFHKLCGRCSNGVCIDSGKWWCN